MSLYVDKNYYYSGLVHPSAQLTGAILTPDGYGFKLDNLLVTTENAYTGYIRVEHVSTHDSNLNFSSLHAFTGTSGYIKDIDIGGDVNDTLQVKTSIPISGNVYYRYGISYRTRQ